MTRATVMQLRLASLSAFTVVKLTSVLIEGDCYLNGGSWSGIPPVWVGDHRAVMCGRRWRRWSLWLRPR